MVLPGLATQSNDTYTGHGYGGDPPPRSADCGHISAEVSATWTVSQGGVDL